MFDLKKLAKLSIFAYLLFVMLRFTTTLSAELLSMTNRILPSRAFKFYKFWQIFLLIIFLLTACSSLTGEKKQQAEREDQKALDKAMALLSNPEVTDKSAAIDQFQQACEMGNNYGCHKVGIAYNNGIHGKSKDYNEAKKWYLRAANNGYVPSQLNIANLYAHRLLPLDDETGYLWLAKADKGLRECRSGSVEVETNVSETERRRMCKLAINFYRKILSVYRKRMDGEAMMKIENVVNKSSAE